MRPRLRRLLGRVPPSPPLVHPTPFAGDEKARKRRNEAAASLVEDDTFGYIVVRLRGRPNSASSRIEVVGHVMPAWWPAFREVLERVIHCGSEFYPED